MPLQATSGAASQDAFGGNGVAVVPAYIEDVFSCFLYTGTGNGTGTVGTVATITNNIDLSTKGGLVWIKNRGRVTDHGLYDTTRGALNGLQSNGTSGQSTYGNTLTAFTTSGFSLGNDGSNTVNLSGDTYASWTFREQSKFFDVVTYTGNGTAGRTVAHNLGSVPACIIVKNTSASGDWWNVYHRSLGATKALFLNDTGAASTQTNIWNNTEPTSTVFSLGTSGEVNRNGDSFVAYLFAHDAGGFGLTGTDNVISCGSYTGNSGTQSISLGYEPQWLLIKKATASGNNRSWWLTDNMRGFALGSGADTFLFPNTSGADSGGWDFVNPTATGFDITTGDDNFNTSGISYIYIAIRRGPMKVPTTGTSVYNAIARTGTGAAATVTGVGFAPDLIVFNDRNANRNGGKYFVDKLRGNNLAMSSTLTSAEALFNSDNVTAFGMDGISAGSDSAAQSTQALNYSGQGHINWFFRRAPSFFDEVCYTGTGSARTVTHNLQAVPELMIVKCRGTPTSSGDWDVYTAASGPTKVQFLNTTDDAVTQSTHWNDTAPTSSVFTVGTNGRVNESGLAYVAYLFATCASVSKVGSYTGTATTKQIDCGFTGGARFVLIKRTDSTGAWYVWDTARGIIAGNDPYLLLNSTAAEVTSTDYIDTYSAGFEISSTAPAAINASGGTYIFLAIA